MRFKRKSGLEKGRLDIAPLVDVVLLLLIFFMLTSSFINPAGIEVKLPGSTVATVQEKDDPVISITAVGELFWNNVEVSFRELQSLLTSEYGIDPSRAIVIRADREVAHGVVVEIMSLAREAGWERLAISAQRVDSEQSQPIP